VELILRIDFVLVTVTVIGPTQLLDVLAADSTLVTRVVEALICRGVTFVGRCLECILVCLHDVGFWTEVTADLVCVTVPVIILLPVVAILVFTRRFNHVESRNTAAISR